MSEIKNDAPDAQEFYEAERVRLQDQLLETDPASDEYGLILSRLDTIDNHKNLVVEREVLNARRQEKGLKHWVSGLNPNTVFEVLGGAAAYIGGIKIVVALEKNGGAFVSGAKSLFSKIRLRL